jgi:hypothetical protein
MISSDSELKLARDDTFPPTTCSRMKRRPTCSAREELHRLLAEARAAQTMPWDAKRVTLYQTIFPQMTNWLPAEEAAQLRFEFEAELARLEAA